MRRESISIFIFRRDLRISDNLALARLTTLKLPILPIFIFNSSQINPEKNKYYSVNAFVFMIECLQDLQIQLKDQLLFFHDKDLSVLDQILKTYDIVNIGFNTDYTPFARTRDSNIIKWCENKNINIITEEDYSLYNMGSILSLNEKPYQVFTPFYNKCTSLKNMILDPMKLNIIKTIKNKSNHLSIVKDIRKFITDNSSANRTIIGGRNNGLELLKLVESGTYIHYDKLRDFPALNKTTRLSAYIKFGCISIREVYHIFKRNNELLRQLLWREFYAHIVWHFPKVLNNYAFKDKYNDIEYNKIDKKWIAFLDGKTGFPLIDAAIRQIKLTGYMHNRLRMLVCNFITKDLFLDWRISEKWFATHLIDYDPASNSGGNQSCAGVGVDAQPWFRTMNPFIQSQKFDTKCEFIYKYIPELKSVPCKDIHEWHLNHHKYPNINYPIPILDHAEQMRHIKIT